MCHTIHSTFTKRTNIQVIQCQLDTMTIHHLHIFYSPAQNVPSYITLQLSSISDLKSNILHGTNGARIFVGSNPLQYSQFCTGKTNNGARRIQQSQSLLELPVLSTHRTQLLYLLRVEPLHNAVHVEAMRTLAPN